MIEKHNDLFKEIVPLITSEIEELIIDNHSSFIEEQTFEIIYKNELYNLNQTDCTNENSLENLIHHLMWDLKLYNRFLDSDEWEDCKKVIEEMPEAIYYIQPDYESDDDNIEYDESIREMLDYIYYECNKYTLSLLEKYDFFEMSEDQKERYLYE